ncbi:MAG: hypothetical protein HOJ90_13250 [Alphaproteobacteria bacterium]|jgi:ankyrin repeat protein|nr:hypothetical protein [Alphaproteobacteria bacterium]
MYFSAGTSGIVHTVVVAASLFTLPAIELAFGDRFGKGQTRDVLTYGESNDFQSKFTSGALTQATDESTADETTSGLDPDSFNDTDSSGEFGFDEVGNADQTDSRFGSPEEAPVTEAPAGGEGSGTDPTLEAAAEGTQDERGDSGEADDPGEATREIIIFVNLSPEPRPDEDAVEPDPARAQGTTDIPAAVASNSTGETPTEVAALDSDDQTSTLEEPRSGAPEGLAEGESDQGRKSEGDPTQAAAPNLGELSPPDSAAALKTETPGSSLEELELADESSLAAVQTTTSINPDEIPPGLTTPRDATTVAEQAAGQPGLPDQNNEQAAKDTPLPADLEPRPELSVTVPAKGFAGLDTPAERIENADKLVDPQEPGAALARIGGLASGIEEEFEGERGLDNEDPQNKIQIADGNPNAQIAASKADEPREGVRENGIEDAGETTDNENLSSQIASLDAGDEFRAPDRGTRDRAALARGPLDPLARVIAAIAGENEALARALTNPKSADTIGGVPDPGELKTNDLLEKAAEAGLARAQTKLAERYLLGLVEGSSPEEIFELLRNAAENGDQEAQLLLGALLADGNVIPKDLVQSHVFFELASAQGNEEANEMLPVLERQMTPREVVDSRRLARQYRRLLDATADARSRGSNGDGLRDQLLDAAAAGNTAKIAELLSRGADLEGNDTAGRTAVINAAWRGEQEVVDLLIELEADLNVADYSGRTAVSWAASNGHDKIVRKLLENGARATVSDEEGLSPLMRAAWNGHVEVVRLLIDAGSQLSGTDDKGNSALHYAEQGGHREIARILRAFGA